MKVNDGIVLASDSASAIIAKTPSGALGVANIYDNANKIFNLIEKQPIGLISWGAGSIGKSSISTLTKDFRNQLGNGEIKSVIPDYYSIKRVAKAFKKFIYDDLYLKEYENWDEKPNMGFMIVGYSSNTHFPEEWKIDIQNNICKGPYKVRGENEIGITWNGEPEAINRLFLGYSPNFANVLEESGLKKSKIKGIIELAKKRLPAPMVIPAMPIQDAIDLADFLVYTTAQYSRFTPGAPTVGGPTEIAAITKHEGFKWIKRKHYYDQSLNLGVK